MRLWLLPLTACVSLFAQMKLPSYTREALPNGAVAYYIQRTGLPLVSFRVLVKGGLESEPPALSGLSSMTAELLRRGTAARTAAQFSDEIDGLGGTFAASNDEQATVVTAEFLKKDFDRGIALVADALLRPTFPEDEVRKALARRSDSLKATKDNPGAAIGQYFRSFFFGAGHPYGRIPDEASLAKIRRDDILDYHRRLYTGPNLIIVVAGDFEPAAARVRVAETFGAAPAGGAYAWMDDRPPAFAAGPRVLLVDKPDATQTYFAIGQPGVRRGTPDRVPLLLANILFGGRFTSMLNEELRTNTGLTYGASSGLQMSRLTGSLSISTYTRTETTARAIDLALEILGRFAEKGLTAEQLASAKAYLKGTFPAQRMQTADQIGAILGEMELFGLGPDDVDQLFSRVDAVTVDQANAVVRRYYRATNLTFVLLGNAAKIREAAAKYAPKMSERSVTQSGWSGL